MKQAEKEVDGFELERAEDRKRESELVEADEQELYDLDGKPERDRKHERSGVILAAVNTILAREQIVINNLDLDKRELKALEALKTAVDGRDQEINGFVYAEDRRTLLEQALAVLQPDLAIFERDGGELFQALVQEISELRMTLANLEDAQQELVEGRVGERARDAADSDDKPEDAADADTSLTGPERKLDKPASSLTGAERAAPPKPSTSLGDPQEIEVIAKKPWWKRLTGG